MPPPLGLLDGNNFNFWTVGSWLWSSINSYWNEFSVTFARICHLSVILSTARIVSAPNLSDVCTPDYVRQVLPYHLDLGITIDPISVSTKLVTNASLPTDRDSPGGIVDYCDVSFAYAHHGQADDRIVVQYWVPAPALFKDRYLSTGGFGFKINDGELLLPLGPLYGAVSGRTDAGFGDFSRTFDQVIVLPNGTINEYMLKMSAYQAMYELTTIGKRFTQQFFHMSNRKLYAYFEGCSEGGRDGWSQIQRYASQFDGLVTGAPAFRFSHQQIQQLWSSSVEQRMGYFPPFCEMEQIWKEVIVACDPLDGKVDGVVARSELCEGHLNLNTIIGTPYFCPAQRRMVPSPYLSFLDLPTQNGSVTPEAVALVRKIWQGAHNEQGKRLYFSYQPGASFIDAMTKFNYTINSYEIHVHALAGAFVSRLLLFRNSSVLDNLDDINFDTLQEWMMQGWNLYDDTLQTNKPYVAPFQRAGGKVLMYHGEADDSIPAASSVRYWEAVRSVVYPNMSYNDSVAALNEWCQLYLVPGADHCGMNLHSQENAPWPLTKLAVLIDWVEKGVFPQRLNATYRKGVNKGQNAEICGWPLRPLWSENGTQMECVYDQKSIDKWQYNLDAFDWPVY